MFRTTPDGVGSLQEKTEGTEILPDAKSHFQYASPSIQPFLRNAPALVVKPGGELPGYCHRSLRERAEVTSGRKN